MQTEVTNEKPILFTDQNVQRILAGRKTQTRRLMKPQPTISSEFCVFTAWNESVSTHDSREPDPSVVDEWMCPFGYRGTTLWVREAWSPDHAAFYPHYPIVYRADGCDPVKDTGKPGYAWSPETKSFYPFKWRPSIHMPRQHCRLRLTVEEIRSERLQSISTNDCAAEGVEPLVSAYAELWDSINGAIPGADWASDPWVWVVTFAKQN